MYNLLPSATNYHKKKIENSRVATGVICPSPISYSSYNNLTSEMCSAHQSAAVHFILVCISSAEKQFQILGMENYVY